MAVKEVVDGLYRIPLGPVNAYLIESETLTLIDTGYPGSPEKIMAAVKFVGRKPEDLQHILLTHGHPDHAGGLAAVKQATGAAAYMHPQQAAVVKSGKVPPHLKRSPGLLNRLLFSIFIGSRPATYDPADVEHEIRDDQRLDIAGGIRAVHTPGHCRGHLVFLWEKHGGVLFAGDAASNIFGLGYSLGYQDLDEAEHSLAKIAALDFQVACFAHGKPIVKQAYRKFRHKWGRKA